MDRRTTSSRSGGGGLAHALVGALTALALLQGAAARCVCRDTSDADVDCGDVKTLDDLLDLGIPLKVVSCISVSPVRVALEGDLSRLADLTSVVWL